MKAYMVNTQKWTNEGKIDLKCYVLLSFSLNMSSILTKNLIKNWNNFVIYVNTLKTQF